MKLHRMQHCLQEFEKAEKEFEESEKELKDYSNDVATMLGLVDTFSHSLDSQD